MTAGVKANVDGSAAIQVGGSDAINISSGLSVGIGTSSPAASLSVTKQTTALSGTGNSYGLYMYPTSSGLTYIDAITNSTGNTSLGFRTYNNGTYNEMRMDSSGNVGIGTSSPPSGSRLAVVGGGIQLSGGTTSQAGVRVQVSSGVATISGINNDNNAYNPLAFYTGASEAARIDSSGKLLVGSTNSNGGLFKVQTATNICFSVENATVVSGSLTLSAINDAASANIPLDFRASAIHASSGIATTATAANAVFSSGENNRFYRSTSALKYKHDIRDLPSIDVSNFRPIVYKSKCENDDQTKDHFGIIADEVDAAGIKELVTYGENNEIEGFQYERLTVVLLKAIQEQQQTIETLQAKVAALEGA